MGFWSDGKETIVTTLRLTPKPAKKNHSVNSEELAAYGGATTKNIWPVDSEQ